MVYIICIDNLTFHVCIVGDLFDVVSTLPIILRHYSISASLRFSKKEHLAIRSLVTPDDR